MTDFQDEALIFLHIPKSGGMTLHSIIDAQYPAEQVYTIDGARARESLAAFKQLPESERAKFRVIKGHMPFGMHQYLPRPATYITLLRDPVDRAVSYYYHVLRSPDHTHHAAVIEQEMDIDAFLRSGISRIADNGQVRMLAACEEAPFGQCTEAMLERAQSNLEQHFAVVGLTERFDESLLLMSERFGWRIKTYRKRNVGVNRVAKEEAPRETLRFIEELNRFDLQLYAYAQRRLDAAIQARGVEFSRYLLGFRLSSTIRHHYRSLRKHFTFR